MNIIEGLEIAENLSLRKDEMKNFEFFECDDCGRLCKMPMEQYKSYSEEAILNATYKCKKCTKPQKELFIQHRNAGKSILDIQRIFGLDHNKMYKLINDWGLKGWKPNKLADTQHNEVNTQHKEPEPLDHLREVKEMVTDTNVTARLPQHRSLVFEEVPAADTVNHPPHYTSGSIECIDAINEAIKHLPGHEGYYVGNIIKYIWRYKHKNGKEDLLKARWYLQRLIDKQEG